MAGSVVGKILSCVVLIVLCFILGAQAAESAVLSVAYIAAIVGAVFMLILGPRCWMLLFLLPPVLGVLPLPDSLKTIAMQFLVAPVILAYWIAMWAMGYVKIRWRSLLLLDLLIFLVVVFLFAAYLKNPVSIAVLGLDTDTVGGKVYVAALGMIIHYIALSCIPMEYGKLESVQNWRIWLGLVCVIISTIAGLAGFNGGEEAMAMSEAMEDSRFGAFQRFGSYLGVLLFAHFPLFRFLVNPLLVLGMLVAMAGIMLSGFRSALASLGITFFFITCIRKEFVIAVCLALTCYGGLFVLNSDGGLRSLPLGVQRALSFVPGLSVDKNISKEAEGSIEWRLEMWQWAMDPRTGFIKDYVWGDGFGLSASEMQRDERAVMRGEMYYGDQDSFARRKIWHNMPISLIQGVGYVGLAVSACCIIYTCLLAFRVCCSLRGTRLFVPALVLLMPSATILVLFPGHAGNEVTFMNFLANSALVKLLFCEARERGLIIPWMQRKYYVPKMIQEHGDQLKPAA